MAIPCTHLFCRQSRWLKSELGLPRIEKMNIKLKAVSKTLLRKIRLPDKLQDAQFNLNFRRTIDNF